MELKLEHAPVVWHRVAPGKAPTSATAAVDLYLCSGTRAGGWPTQF